MLLTHSIFQHFISAHAKIIDKFLSDPRANYNDTVVRDKILFYDEGHSDPNIPKGGWVGGDSWFGLTASAVEVMSKFGVHSSWIIKQNQQWFPMKHCLQY